MRVVDLPAGAALGWMREAYRLFKREPAQWIALAACWVLLSMALLLVPMIGPPLCILLQPALFAGFVLAARDQEHGLSVEPAHLFAGLRANGRQLVALGSIALILEFAIMLLLSALGMPSPPLRSDGLPDFQAWQLSLAGKEWIVILGLGLVLLVKGVLWFTAPLMAMRPMAPGVAIRWSAFALVANIVPLVLLAAAMAALFVLATLPLMLGLPIWLPLYALVHYTSYKTTFVAETGELA
jgi:uncharacterized membrane protein